MKLSQEQVNSYLTEGFLIVESLFLESEVNMLKQALQDVDDQLDLPNIIREENGAIRSVFAPQTLMEAYGWLYQQERLITPTQQLINEEVYLYQYKLNNKKGFDGGIWEWHQDFPFWHLDDGVQSPDMVSVMVLLQDTDYSQGPLMFIPKSHIEGIVEFQHKEHQVGKELKLENSLNADLKYTIKKELIRKMVAKNGITGGIGKAGTCIFFHPNVYHGSNANISPYDRDTAIITYNSIKNLPEDRHEANRPEYICSRDFGPIKGIGNESLLVKV